jgi:hypothetical protein
MLEIAKQSVNLIETVIENGYFTIDNTRNMIKERVNNLLEEINERKKVSTSPTKLFNLLINTLLLIKNEENLDMYHYVDTISKLTYNRYQIKKEIEEEERALAKKIREKIEAEQKTLFKVKKKTI